MKNNLVIYKLIFLITCGSRVISKIVKMIGRGTRHCRIRHPCRRACIAPIVFSFRVIRHLFMSIIRAISTKFDLNFEPVNSNCSDEKISRINPRNMSFYQNVCCKEKTNDHQQMTPNKFSKLFKVFFLYDVNFNPFCFGEITGCKSRNQNRRIDKGDGSTGQKNRSANTNHDHKKHMTPYQITQYFQSFNHDNFSNSSYLNCTTNRLIVDDFKQYKSKKHLFKGFNS